LKKRLPKKKKLKNVKKIDNHDDMMIERKKQLRDLGQRELTRRKTREVGRAKNDETTVLTEEWRKKVHVNREIFAFADKNLRFSI